MAYTSDTYRLMRSTRLLQTGELDGVRFIRCIPHWLQGETRTRAVLNAVTEINEAGVCLANNPEFGGDYLRVNVATQAYRLIGEMLS